MAFVDRFKRKSLFGLSAKNVAVFRVSTVINFELFQQSLHFKDTLETLLLQEWN